MNYGELRAYFKDFLNRDDCTDDQADTFIAMGLRRVERLLRTPIQKTTFTRVVDENWQGFEPIPIDYIGLYSVVVDGIPVPRITLGQIGMFRGFYVDGADIRFNPEPPVGSEIKITYYNEFLRGVSDEAITDYSLVLTDVAVYAALVFAGDFFMDTRKDVWEMTLKTLIQEVQLMADQDEMTGGVYVMAPYGGGIA